jgi:membrane-associated HD superfamily phosphohydrolase
MPYQEYLSGVHPSISRCMILSGAKVAKEKIKDGKDITEEKIKEQQEAAEERKAEKDAENISKMGDLAVQFSSSFDNIVSEISSTRTYAEQEQIYKGFIKLLEQQRELLVARKDLAARLKGSVQQEPIALKNKIKQPQLTEGKQRQQQNQLPKASELPMLEPQLPEIISAAA